MDNPTPLQNKVLASIKNKPQDRTRIFRELYPTIKSTEPHYFSKQTSLTRCLKNLVENKTIFIDCGAYRMAEETPLNELLDKAALEIDKIFRDTEKLYKLSVDIGKGLSLKNRRKYAPGLRRIQIALSEVAKASLELPKKI